MVYLVFANQAEVKSLYETSSFETALELLRKDCRIAAVTRSEKGSVIIRGDETYEIALVTDVGNIDDQSFNQAAWEGVVEYATTNNITYAYYRVRGAMVNFLQRVEARAPIPVEEMEHVASEPFDYEGEDWRLTLKEGMERLPSRESEIIEALLVEGRRARELAAEQGIDVSQIYRIQRRGLARLKAWFGAGESTS